MSCGTSYHWLLIRSSMGTIALCLTDTIFHSPDLLPGEPPSATSPLPRVCPYPLKRPRRGGTIPGPGSAQPTPYIRHGDEVESARGVRFYLQRRKPDSTVIILGKAAAKYFYRFVSFSNSLDVAAAKLNSLTGGDGGVASVAAAYVPGSDPDEFFQQMDVLLQGTDQDKQVALQLLSNASQKVGPGQGYFSKARASLYSFVEERTEQTSCILLLKSCNVIGPLSLLCLFIVEMQDYDL
jgi:hypothetical protein